ncbi:MAG TPA: ATP synthase F1 subunit delta [Solirubrobacteraceae bacterium]|nr:ATP synthase F1 subunit delta [Solirubrobacteraceae bacterium]
MEEIAAVYARALFEAAEQAGRLDEVREQLGEVADSLDEQRDLQVFFFSPYFSSEEKRDGLNRAVTGADPLVTNFLELLIENHRMPVIFRMRRELDHLWEEHNRLLGVQVTSAIPLQQAEVEEIGRRVGEQTGRRVELTSEVDPDILGGIVLRVGNAILDASVRNRLEQLRKEVARA